LYFLFKIFGNCSIYFSSVTFPKLGAELISITINFGFALLSPSKFVDDCTLKSTAPTSSPTAFKALTEM